VLREVWEQEAQVIQLMSSVLYSFLEKIAEMTKYFLKGSGYGPSQIIRSIWENQGSVDPLPGTQ
jgi:hypothetical protein